MIMAYQKRPSNALGTWANMLRDQHAACVAGDVVEAGAMGLRFSLVSAHEMGLAVDAERLTRQLVRHLRANGRIPE